MQKYLTRGEEMGVGGGRIVGRTDRAGNAVVVPHNAVGARIMVALLSTLYQPLFGLLSPRVC